MRGIQLTKFTFSHRQVRGCWRRWFVIVISLLRMDILWLVTGLPIDPVISKFRALALASGGPETAVQPGEAGKERCGEHLNT